MADIPPWHPPLRLRLLLVAWRLAWVLLMPAMLGYLWYRGRRDPLYRRHLGQRFGRHARRDTPHVWIHAVSIGELRSAVPLIRALLDRDERVVTTHFTPAGLREAQKVFAAEIAEGRVASVYVPFDYGLAFYRFFRAFRPRFGLVMEVEFWPGMIVAARRSAVPLFLCNGQYPARSFERDRTRRLSPGLLVPGFAGVMVKSGLQADRFRHFGQTRIAITGELRFEQPLPPEHLAAARAARHTLIGDRPVTTLASVVEWEEELFIDTIAKALETGSDKPFFVFVPRAPERFDEVARKLELAGLRTIRRSQAFDPALKLTDPQPADILLGDSLGEMYFYLELGDRAVAGGGFNPNGSHNIIEPLALGKPVIVGPEIWTIEYPAIEAIDAGVARQVPAEGLISALSEPVVADDARIAGFLADHAGAVGKTLTALSDWRVI